MWTEHLYVDPPNLLWHQRRPERSNYIIPILINVCPLEYLEHKSRTSEHSTLGPSLTSDSQLLLGSCFSLSPLPCHTETLKFTPCLNGQSPINAQAPAYAAHRETPSSPGTWKMPVYTLRLSSEP